MDLLAALGLAANVLQLIDISVKVASVFRTGSTIRNNELAIDVGHLKSCLSLVKDPNFQLSPGNHELANISVVVAEIAEELLAELSKASADTSSKLLTKASASFHAVWGSGAVKVKAKEDRLKTMHDTLQFGLTAEILRKVERQTVMNDAAFRSFNDQTRRAVEDVISQFQIERTDVPQLDQDGTPVEDDILRVLRSRLEFDSRDDRQAAINPKHAKTFEWLYNSPRDQEVPWESFVDWLETPGGTYWISGKAGSGKSTLMKYLAEKEIEKQEASSDESPALILSFFFWNLGTYLARSQEGLLRSILLQAIEREPALGRVVFPEYYARDAKWGRLLKSDSLRRAFDNLTKQRLRKVLFIIDGLDEFETDTMSFKDLGALFAKAAESPHIKALLASRPINQLEDPLGTAQLHLHDLTRPDIAEYVTDKLKENPRVIKLSEQTPIDADSLIHDIVICASGIFLWVRLVVESVLDGLDNYDSVEELRKRLREIPRDLDMLFESMVSKIPERYQTSWSAVIQLVQLARDVSLHNNHRAVLLSFAHLSHAEVLAAEIEPLAPTEMEARMSETCSRLKAHTAGLVEVASYNDSYDDPWLGLRIDYIHWSVAEFLHKNWKRLVEEKQAPGFNAARTLLDCTLMQVKTYNLQLSRLPENIPYQFLFLELWALVVFAMDIAKCSPITMAVDVFDASEQTMEDHMRRIAQGLARSDLATRWWQVFHSAVVEEAPHPQHETQGYHASVFSLAVQCGLEDYVLTKLARCEKGVTIKGGVQALYYASCEGPSLYYRRSKPEPRIVEALLQRGVSPNATAGQYTPWQASVYSFGKRSPGESGYSEHLRVLKLLIQHGADPNAVIDGRGTFSTMKVSVLFAFLRAVYQGGGDLDQGLESEVLGALRRKGAKAKLWEPTKDCTLRRVYIDAPYLVGSELAPSRSKRLSERIPWRRTTPWMIYP